MDPIHCRICSRYLAPAEWPEHVDSHPGGYCQSAAPGVSAVIVCREPAGHTGLCRSVNAELRWAKGERAVEVT